MKNTATKMEHIVNLQERQISSIVTPEGFVLFHVMEIYIFLKYTFKRSSHI